MSISGLWIFTKATQKYSIDTCKCMQKSNMDVFKRTFFLLVLGNTALVSLSAQIAVTGFSASPSQAVVQYTAPVAGVCTAQLADMNRAIAIVSGAQNNGQVTIQTQNPHGLLAGAVVYIEKTGVWDGWQTVIAIPTSSSFTFASAIGGNACAGNVGVLIDDVNPALFAGANQDSRPGNIILGQPSGQGGGMEPAGARTFVFGKRTAEVALDGNRYSRALQVFSRHHLTLTCGAQSYDHEFRTGNIPRGDTYNEGPPADRNNPGQYAYPTVQWSNQAQSLIDPLSGLRSVRATTPAGAPSTVQNFVTAVDTHAAWQNASAPLNNFGGAASYSGPCNSGACALFLRADNLSIPGGPTYTSTATGNSLDWVTVTVNQASIGSACSGDDCKIVACLTVNGISCASGNQEASLSMIPANFTFGSGHLMDLWQTSGAPAISRVDASLATGTINYTSATRQVSLANGNVFNVRWTAGSAITIAGGQYTIASVQHERLLTLQNGPAGNLSGVPYSANNFGVLLWKKTAAAGRVSLGYTTFLYGSSPMGQSSASPNNPCSPVVTVNGVAGYNCFVNTELYWLAADGSDLRDLGQVATTYYADGRFADGAPCGNGAQLSQFDPQNGDIWYCTMPVYFDFTRYSLVQAHYMGNHTRNTPGQRLPDCTLDHGVQPCIQFTIMQPNKADSINVSGPAFNPDFAASGYQIGYIFQGGISADGDIMFYTNAGAQDTLGWIFMYTLGDRTPAGTDANSVHIVGAASTYRKAPLSWCTIHNIENPDSGWAASIGNNYTIAGPLGTYTMTMTSPPLNTTLGAAGGLNACPANPFGVTGNLCTTITVTGQPVSQLNGTVLQKLQVGDRITIGSESLRVLSIAGPAQFTVQRGYISTPAAQIGNTLTMACGTMNIQSASIGLWNYRNDPYGANPNFSTILNDPNILNAHHFTGNGVSVTTGGAAYNLGQNLCPAALLGNLGECLQVRLGSLVTASESQPTSIAMDPQFAGVVGIGNGNQVDSHPGPCFTTWCMDARPLDGGSNLTLGSAAAPFTNISGQLWKISGGQALLNRKYLNTFAYAGRWPLVDVSGPGSSLGNGAADSYKYCYALVAGECGAGSSAGDVYINAPFVDYPYCLYPGIAVQGDDALSICIGDLGAYTGNVVQYDVTQHDLVGNALRRLGPTYAKWNQFDVFWNTFAAPSGGMYASLVRWLDGVRSDDIVTALPPLPAPDGVSRNTFIPVTFTGTPPAGGAVQSAVIEFGYVENGPATNFYCTSRQETCVATAPAINLAAPFYYEQTEAYTPAACAHTCTISIPAVPHHALYYRWKYLGATGQVVATSNVRAILTP